MIFEKQHNDVRTNLNTKVFLESVAPDQVIVYGVASDVCVDLAVKYLARDLGYRVTVASDAIKEIDPIKERRCIAEWSILEFICERQEILTKL